MSEEERDVVVALTWKESDRVLWALRHPRDKDAPAVFGLLRERIGEGRLALADAAARRQLDRIEERGSKP